MVRFAGRPLGAAGARRRRDRRANAARGAAAYDLPPLPEVTSASLAKHIYYSASANWLLPGRVLLGANPTRGSVDAVARSCDAAVSLQEPHETNAVYDHAFSSWTSYPLPDLAPAPSLDALDGIVQKLAARVRNGEIVYVHCAYGRGRRASSRIIVRCALPRHGRRGGLGARRRVLPNKGRNRRRDVAGDGAAAGAGAELFCGQVEP